MDGQAEDRTVSAVFSSKPPISVTMHSLPNPTYGIARMSVEPNSPLPQPAVANLIAACLSLDLEVSVKTEQIYALAALHGAQEFVAKQSQLPAAYRELDRFAADCQFLLGHNLLAFDLPHLTAAQPNLRLLHLPVIDTLLLNPLAFPRNPYHHLVKHYQDARIVRGCRNDPKLDAELCLTLLQDQLHALAKLQASKPDLLLAWHWLTSLAENGRGFDAVFSLVRAAPRPSDFEAQQAIQYLLQDQSCLTQQANLLQQAKQFAWEIAYLLAWLSVAGGDSVLSPWVHHTYPHTRQWIRSLRDVGCLEPACTWCRTRHDPTKELQHWFGLPSFREKPSNAQGQSLQQLIVTKAMAGQHVLGILPTGTGKSLCYQIPAISRFDKTGSLTVVISPLVALMADQVTGLAARGISCSAAINGLLTMPERSDVLERLRLGEIGILLLAPEQLRSITVRKVLAQREIGMWVFDEAHCVSKWGHDFRPDYRYLGRVIKTMAGDYPVPPVLCLTATAKPDVVADILDFFQQKVGISLQVVDGGAERHNLDFVIIPTSPVEKLAHIEQLLHADLPRDADGKGPGGAIVYCASRRKTEEIAEFLQLAGWQADFFHAGLSPERKKDTQRRFIDGELRVITATNAFGMGIDKPDVRLVIHADIPGSLENYLQEAGRAGRDQQAARCVLLHTIEDVEWQFGMSARSRLTQREINAILRSLKRLEKRNKGQLEKDTVVATVGELLLEDVDAQFHRDQLTDDTRVRTALAWLEEAQLLRREENRVQVYPSSLLVPNMEEAEKTLASAKLQHEYHQQLLRLVRAIMLANSDDGITTDELMHETGLSPDKTRAALYDLERLGLANNDTALTAFVHIATANASSKRLEQAIALENALLDLLRAAAPDLAVGDPSWLHLRIASQELKDAGHSEALPDKLRRLLHGLAVDGRNENVATGSIRLKRWEAESLQVTLLRDWPSILRIVKLRHNAAVALLQHWLSCANEGARGADILVQSTQAKLSAALRDDLTLQGEVRDYGKLQDRALLWLHEQEVLRLNKGLAVFRPAMTIELIDKKRSFLKSDFAPLQVHYEQQVVQIHVMAEYVQRGLQHLLDASSLVRDYFRLSREQFLALWLPQSSKEIQRQTTPESWRKIVEALQNPVQQNIVTDERENANMLVLAAPGSGKTRVLVHRIAYLLRVKRANPRSILALAYNRHAAQEIRQRLFDLIGDDAAGVLVLTCHAMAMRLAGVSFNGKQMLKDDEAFAQVLRDALAVLNGQGLTSDEADAQRQRLLGGFRWILVDEYQDIGEDQYALISALAGRTLSEDEGRLNLFAVGDDDQNIYAYAGASVRYIRQFEQDYAAKAVYLLENYRSSSHIIAYANYLIAPVQERMKRGQAIHINQARRKLPTGGAWQQRDVVGKGRVQILPVEKDPYCQAHRVLQELQRLAKLDPAWDWCKVAIIGRRWKSLQAVYSYCQQQGISAQLALEENLPLMRLRETQQLLHWILQDSHAVSLLGSAKIQAWLDAPHGKRSGKWWDVLREALAEYALETAGAQLPRGYFIEWLSEWAREMRQKQSALLLTTAHRAKGLEFEHVAVLDDDWQTTNENEDRDAPRRLFYVAITRARATLLLAKQPRAHAFLPPSRDSGDDAWLWREAYPPTPQEPSLRREYQRLFQRLSLRHVHLSFAGQFPAADPLHAALAQLQVGDALELRWRNNAWELRNARGQQVGRLANGYVAPPDMQCVQAKVAAIFQRRREDTEPQFQARLQVDEWEVLLPELVWQADGG